MAKASTGAATSGHNQRRRDDGQRLEAEQRRQWHVAPQQRAGRDAHHERGDDAGALGRSGKLIAGERDAQQHGIARHRSGERVEDEEAHGVGIARDDGEKAGLPDRVVG